MIGWISFLKNEKKNIYVDSMLNCIVKLKYKVIQWIVLHKEYLRKEIYNDLKNFIA